MSVVVDASATIALIYREPEDAASSRLETRIASQGAFVPQLWQLEIANVLLIGYRRHRHDLQTVNDYLADLPMHMIDVDPHTCTMAWSSILQLAAKHRLTSYDAAYLELAQRRRLPLATLDKELSGAASAEGVSLFWD